MGNRQLGLSIASVIEVMEPTQDPWWVIGSAAVALHGDDPGEVADIDVIVSRRDLDALYERLPLSNTPDMTKSMFRSERFGLWSEPDVPVEFMAGLEIQVGGNWLPVEPRTRQAVSLGEHAAFVPEREELVAILHQFGRPKDLARAATLTGD